MIKQEASRLLEVGYKIIPLLQNQKHNSDKEILTRNYLLEDFDKLTKQFNKPHTNLGINLAKSFNGLIDIDLDCKEAIKLAPKFFPADTAIIGRNNKERLEITHFLFKKDQDYSNYNLDRIDLNRKKIIEFRIKGNLVVPPSITPNKDDESNMMPRVWVNQTLPAQTSNIFKIFNWCSFASFIYPFIESANTGVLTLDGCIKRYTDLTDSERLKFIEIILSTKFPEKWNRDKDFKPQKIRRIIKANNNDVTKTAGYKKFADYHKLDPLEIKRALSWVGNVPDEETKSKSKKTIMSFMENGLDIIVVTSRREWWRGVTSIWMAKNGIYHDALYMRKDGDFRKDYEVKDDILFRINKQWDVLHAFDDNPSVIELWEKNGIPTTKIGDWDGSR